MTLGEELPIWNNYEHGKEDTNGIGNDHTLERPRVVARAESYESTWNDSILKESVVELLLSCIHGEADSETEAKGEESSEETLETGKGSAWRRRWDELRNVEEGEDADEEEEEEGGGGGGGGEGER